MENAAAPIFGIASSGHVTEWNAAMQALTGAASEKALQRSFVSEFIPEHAQPIIQGHIDNVLQGWMVDKFECPIRDAQGKIHLVLMSCTARRNASDEITGAINIGQDITDRQLAERELQRINELLEQGVAERTQEITVANQKLQHELAERLRIEEELRRSEEQLVLRVEERTAELSAANTELSRVARLKDEFLASMSHELRTPLSGIMGLSEALKEEIYGPLNERQRRSVDVVIESSRHLLTLINDILDISKIGAGKFELVYEWFMIESVIRSSLDLIRTAAQKKHIEINFRKDVHVSKIYADERRLKQILFNLLMNAVKFTPDGGKIGLEVLADSEQGTIRFAVWDTGIGISKKDMGRLFQPFVQLDSGLARQHPGTGLGLALVYRMTRMMGGSVSVESELHHGSRFTVALPWREYTHGADAAADKELAVQTGASVTKPNAKQGAGLVLIAEDNQATLDAFSDYLASLGYRTVTVHTGIEIITTSKELLPSAILMEIKTPKLNGLEAIRQVRSDPATAHIPIIVVTTMAMPGESERCMTAGATAYLSKPVSIHTIISVLETNIERNRQAEGG
jgi:PAS domain S-box-containing protein